MPGGNDTPSVDWKHFRPIASALRETISQEEDGCLFIDRRLSLD